MNKYIPMTFNNLSILQLQNMEKNVISRGNNEVRFRLLRAAKGSIPDQEGIMSAIKEDPTWIEAGGQ
jgi:hypothetical protein